MVGTPRKFQLGWFGDHGLGERLIRQIVEGRKTATTRPAYDNSESDAEVGDRLHVVDKHGRMHAIVEITKIEQRRWGDFDDELAAAQGDSLAELRESLRFANARDISPDEEMRVVHFRLLQKLSTYAPRERLT